MSLFNLDRFRFDKKPTTSTNQPLDSGSKSPESEKENKPGKMKTNTVPPKSSPRGVVFEDVIAINLEEDELLADPNTKITLTKKSMNADGKSSINIVTDHSNGENSELEKNTDRLLEMFPQRTRSELQDVIRSTSTLDEAVSACLQTFGDEEDQGKKRKQDDSSSSQEDYEIQASKRRRASVVTYDEGKEPQWEKQEAMVRRLQKKFPDQDKEELRMVLQEHDWNVEESLQVLQMFSDPDDSFSSRDSEEKKSTKVKSKDKSSRGHKDKEDNKRHRDEHQDISESDGNDTDATKDSEDEDSDLDESTQTQNKSSTSTLSTWLEKGYKSITSSSSFKKTTTSSYVKPSSSASSSAAQMLSRFASGTSIAKKQAVERKKAARASEEHVSSEEENADEEDMVSSEFEESDDELDTKGGMTDLKKEILAFFQDASIDELSLIAGCSVKKAQKIVELRPFNTWDSLIDVFHKDNGLSEDLLLGCRVVLKERKVVRGLMSKCETISFKMVKQVTEVMERDTVKQPSLINSQFQLKPYQLIGLKWLLLLHDHNLSGILADEMGLGKTIQAIAFLAQLYEDGIEGPHLITVPASTLDNWVRELKMWCPSLNVLVYYGSVEDRRYLRHDILSEAVDYNVIVTTYNLAIGNESDRSLFRKLRLNYAIFDEGHMLKNMNSLRYRHLMAINAEHRLLLTGTPLQNNLLELMSLLNFIMPSMFSSSTTQLSKMFSMKSYEEQSRFERDRISQAKLIMKPFILRRVKSEVLQQLPVKEERIEFCAMSEKQQNLYQTLFKKLKASTSGEKRELCNVMMQLRKMANHPLLHRQYYTTDKLKAMSKLMLKEPTHFDADAALIQEDMEVMSDFELHRLCQQYTSISSYQLETNLVLDSGKFHHLTELLASLKDKGDRVVLFSQFTMMLDIVEVLMRHLKHRYVRLDGSTPIADRIVLIDEYNTDPDIFVFLLSTRAGGLGINLTSANVVILHDIDCNPYNDKQAEDRCHRVGQTRTVQVIKLISKDSIEDCILQLGQKKLKLEQDMTTAEESGEGSIPEDMASILKASLGL
ncbi:SWI/SNF-related matrix-associated actin-dependent regulator of chromatin subfamily A containing DEAD/H box 1A isoform X3 [Sphaeramia orbicularis]|uniref:SWI/SNF-related matrix-associated actin-dependent regulator of chromatin subfamily A containing DEAD/H box 1A isoform X3 n=1 Tax=Sphaeramia orbicularis TaxID=375764 RepID=UPI001180CF5C|nr:SWI/SNF-related matrix-associated actin-dependent regulator of chromatin subfamily A containing DEAD/H box 1 isoform X3 [Sphaeramia orbicularis]